MNKKRLAIITPGFMPVPAVNGGAIEQLIQYFVDGNEHNYQYDIDLYTIDDIQLHNYNYEHTKLIKIKNYQNDSILYKAKYKAINKLNNILNIKINRSAFSDTICKNFKKDYYDIVLIENNMDIYKQLYSKFKNEKIIFHLHNDFDCNDMAKTKAKTEFILDTADKVIVVSNFLKNKLIKLSPLSSNKIHVGYNGIIKHNFKSLSEQQIKIIKNRYGITKNDVVFTFIGRMSKDKGIDKLLLAIQEIDKNKENNIKCLIVGNNFFGTNDEDEYINMLKDMVKGIKSKICFTGYVPNDELYKIYSISDCVVIPAQYEEVFGVVALEAMSMKLPVIASISGGLPEVLTDNCALFIKRGSSFVLNLSTAISKLVSNKELRLKLGSAGEVQSNRFPQTEIQYFNLINRIIKE